MSSTSASHCEHEDITIVAKPHRPAKARDLKSNIQFFFLCIIESWCLYRHGLVKRIEKLCERWGHFTRTDFSEGKKLVQQCPWNIQLRRGSACDDFDVEFCLRSGTHTYILAQPVRTFKLDNVNCIWLGSTCVQKAIHATLVDIAGGLAYLHSVGVLHGDLKVALPSCNFHISF